MHYKQYKKILSPQQGMNLYRGCSHGCIYCDSRSECYQMDHDFEDIQVKLNAPQMLEAELRNKRNKYVIGTGSMTDPYLHVEETLRYTRKSLEIIHRYRHGLAILTKSTRILRDLNLLIAINQHSPCYVQVTLTTYDNDLSRILEPNVSTSQERFEILAQCQKHGIKTVVWLDPLLPFINDTKENIEPLLQACVEYGVYGIIFFGVGLTLRKGNREYFYAQLDRHFPTLRQQYERRYGERYSVMSPQDAVLSKWVHQYCKEHGIICDANRLFHEMHTYHAKEQPQQLRLF